MLICVSTHVVLSCGKHLLNEVLYECTEIVFTIYSIVVYTSCLCLTFNIYRLSIYVDVYKIEICSL